MILIYTHLFLFIRNIEDVIHSLEFVFEWHKRFKEGWEFVRDDEWCGRKLLEWYKYIAAKGDYFEGN